MTGFRVQDGAGHRLDETYDYTSCKWGEAQADTTIRGLFDKFKAIAAREFPWRAIPPSSASTAISAATRSTSSTGNSSATAKSAS